MSFQTNWVDLIIIAILLFMVFDSWKTGFWVILADFLGFLLSLVIALSAYSLFGGILETNFRLSHSLANALGFFVAAGFSEAVIGFVLSGIIRKISYKFWKSPWNNIARMIPSLGQGLVIVSFLVTLVVGLPVSPIIKRDVSESKIGGYLVQKTTGFEAKLNEVFGGLAEESLTYLTVKPGTSEAISLNSQVGNLTIDEESENVMLDMINNERIKRGLSELSLRAELLPVARSHATDMWQRNYFGHVSPDGEDVGDRLKKEDIDYVIAGENLALAPTLQTAHTGLMNSQGHRENILDPEFKRVGIGVIDNGFYGKMFVQVFSD